MSRGKAVRGSSNDDLEEGQQNPTIRYGRMQFSFPNRQLLLHFRLSVNVSVSLACKGTSLYFNLVAN